VSRLRRASLAVASALLVACSTAAWNRVAGDPYELDEVSRAPSDSARPPACEPEKLRIYRGAHVRWEPPVTLAPPFEERVARFERLVAEVGERVYGRAPSRILNAGAYACRAVEHRPDRLSEHALGNALDVTGFRFPALPPDALATAGTATTSGLPPPLRRGFTITVTRDLAAPPRSADLASRQHREFFEQLLAELRRARIFRGMLGPTDPRHQTHLHLDMGLGSYERL
jgi:hypothetical protein